MKCEHCWEVFNLKKHKEYVLAKKILMNYGFSSKKAKQSLEIILTRRSSTCIMDASVLVKLAFANKIGSINE